MQLEQRINAFVVLGKFLAQFSTFPYEKDNELAEDLNPFEAMKTQIDLARSHNGWFTQSNLNFAFESWSNALTEENLYKWTADYTFEDTNPKTVGLVMAGNIPLVGFHDFISVLITGNKVLGKLSSKDKQLLPLLVNVLQKVEPEFEDLISFTENKLEGFDAVIATGSNNTAKYFEYYFGKYPSIIRKNRNSIAVLDGTETKEELEKLADDIFRYFGLGCRNVSKIFIPKEYDFENFFQAMYAWKEIINETKYINNYDYNKAVYLMSNISLLDNEFLLLKEDEGYSSPIAVLFYECYSNIEELKSKLTNESANIQCITAKLGINDEIEFGKAQSPQLWDYADGVDTVDFLLKLSK